MIQKFTCVPIADYDVIVVSNGTYGQISSKLSHINNLSKKSFFNNNCKFTYISNFSKLNEHLLENSYVKSFPGKVIFMFFNDLQYVQDFICDVIDHYSKTHIFNSYYQNPHQQQDTTILENVYFYFDSSIGQHEMDYFNILANIVNDVLKKMNFMVNRIRNVYIDDMELAGERSVPLKRLVNNYPKVEGFQLSSNIQVSFK